MQEFGERVNSGLELGFVAAVLIGGLLALRWLVEFLRRRGN